MQGLDHLVCGDEIFHLGKGNRWGTIEAPIEMGVVHAIGIDGIFRDRGKGPGTP